MGKKSKRKTGKKKGSSGGDNGGGKAAASNNKASKEDKELDKKCDERLAELQYAEKENQEKELQFSVGDRVLCTIAHTDLDGIFDENDPSTWSVSSIILKSLAAPTRYVKSPGTIVQLWYPWKNKIHPYQIRLDEDDKLTCVESETSVVKLDLPPPEVTPHDELLFAQPPHREDCPICMIPLPLQQTQQTKYFSCCGKVICVGCIVHSDEVGLKDICPFCRAPQAKDEEEDTKRLEKRIQSNDPEAMVWSAVLLSRTGNIQDGKKCFQLMKKAADLGLCTAHFNLGCAYSPLNNEGPGKDIIEKDAKKAMFHLEKAAIAGHGGARHFLGMNCGDELGHISFLSMKHFMVGAKSGYENCLRSVKEGFIDGMVTKADFEETLRMYKESLDEISSEQRDKAAAMYPFRSWGERNSS